MLTDTEISVLALSSKVALSAVGFGLPASFAVAYLLARKDFTGKTLIDSLIHLPLIVPPVVVGYLLLALFAPTAPMGRFLDTIGFEFAFHARGAALASFIMAFPLMVRAIRQALEREPKAFREVANTLGVSPMRQFFKISLPLAFPGILTAFILGFARAVGEFGATITFVSNIPGLTQTLPLALYSAAQSPGGEEAAFRLVLLSLTPALLALVASEWFSRRSLQKQGLK